MQLHPIPKTVEEAVDRICDLTEEEIQTVKEHGTAIFHHTVGRTIRNEWKLWADSDLTRDFNSIGLFHADDMSGFLFYHLECRVNKKIPNSEAKIRKYYTHWKEWDEELASKMNKVHNFE